MKSADSAGYGGTADQFTLTWVGNPEAGPDADLHVNAYGFRANSTTTLTVGNQKIKLKADPYGTIDTVITTTYTPQTLTLTGHTPAGATKFISGSTNITTGQGIYTSLLLLPIIFIVIAIAIKKTIPQLKLLPQLATASSTTPARAPLSTPRL